MRRIGQPLALGGLVALASCTGGVRQPAPAPPISTAGPSAPPPASTAVSPPPYPVPAPSAPAVATDSAVFFERPNGALLRPGTFVYALFTRRDSLRTPHGLRTVVVSETTVGGIPSWLIADARTGTAVETRDSLYLARGDLSPERWVASIALAQLAVSFSRDSMFGGLQSYQGRASFAVPLPKGALLTAGMVDRMVELLPLAPGYRAAASLVQLEFGAPRVLPAELAVVGEESAVLLDRLVDCWVVSLRAGTLEERLWVSKEAPRVVKTEQQTSAGILTAVLQP